MCARKTARYSTYPTVDLQPHLASIFGPLRPHVCRRQIWGDSQATFPPVWKALPPVRVPPEAKGRGGRHCLCRNCSWASESSPHPTDINTFHCTYGHAHEVLLKITAEQQRVNLSRKLHECRRCSMAKGLRKPIATSTPTRADTLCPSRAPAVTVSYLRREEYTAGEGGSGEGASGEGASSQGGGRMETLDSKSDLDTTEGWPPVPPATRKAPAAEPEVGVAGVRKATPRHHQSSPGGSISVASTAAVVTTAATTTAPAVTAATTTTAGTFSRPWRDLRWTWRFSASSPNCKADAWGPSRGA